MGGNGSKSAPGHEHYARTKMTRGFQVARACIRRPVAIGRVVPRDFLKISFMSCDSILPRYYATSALLCLTLGNNF